MAIFRCCTENPPKFHRQSTHLATNGGIIAIKWPQVSLDSSRVERGEAVLKATFLGGLIGATMSFLCGIAAAQAEIKVGIAGPLSGSALPNGEQQEIGAQKAFDHLNDQGGLLGEEIVVTSVDDACEPEQAKAAARQLVSEGLILVVGHFCSSASLAASKIYEEAGIIRISPGPTNPKVTDEGGPIVFRITTTRPQFRKLAVNSLQSWLRADRHGIVGKGAKL